MQEICTDSLNWKTAGMGNSELYCGDCRTVFEDCYRVHGHDRTDIRLGCNSMDCPVCHYRIAVREAYKAVSRLRGLWTECRKYGLDLGRPVHMMTSPPPELYHYFSTASMYSKINQMNLHHLKDIGVIGGCTVTHRVRGKPYLIRQYKAREIDLKDAWHFHTVGFMPDGHKVRSDAFYDATGWVYKAIPIIKKGGARNVIAYEVNHAANYGTSSGSSHLLRWWGASSYNAMKLIERRSKEIKACKVCECDKHRYFEDYDNDQGEAYKVTVARQVTLTPAQLAKVASRLSQERKPRPVEISAYVGVIQ